MSEEYTKENGLLIKLFRELLEFNPAFSQFVPVVMREMLLEALQSVNMRVRTKKIIDFILNGYNQKNPQSHMGSGFCHGVPQRIRTPGLLIRSQTLYPAELAAHDKSNLFIIAPC